MTTTAKALPLQVVVGLIDKLTDPWKRMNAQARMQLQVIQRAGQRLTQSVTNPLLRLGAFSLTQASHWESVNKRIQAFTGMTEEEAGRAQHSIGDYADKIGASLDDVSVAVDLAVQKFKTFADLTESVNQASGLAKIMKTSPEQAMRSIIGIKEVFKKESIATIGDTLAKAAISGDADFADQIQRLGHFAAARHLSFQQLVGALVQKQEKFGEPWKLAAKRLREQGTNLQQIAEGNKKLAQQPGMEETLKKLGGGFEEKWERLKNRLVELGETLGSNGVLDGMKALVETAGKLIAAFGKLPNWVQTAIVGFGAISIVVGPMLTTFAGLGRAWQVLRVIGPGLMTVLRGIAGGFRLLGVLAMANPWVLLATAVVAAIMLIATHWDWIVSKIKAFVIWVNSKASWLVPQSFVDWASAPAVDSIGKGRPISSSNSTQTNRSDINIKLGGFPPGTTIETKGDAKITTDMGISPMHHVAGAH